MDSNLAGALATLQTKRKALVEAIRELDALIAGIQRFGANPVGQTIPTVASHSEPSKRASGRQLLRAKPSRQPSRAPRGMVRNMALEAFHGQPARFSVREIGAFIRERHPDYRERITVHRLSNEMNKAEKRHWIKRVGLEGKRIIYEKLKLPPLT